MKKAVKRISHIGIAVRSIAESRPFYEETLGLPYEGEEEVPSQQVRVAFFRVGEVRIELLEPLGEGGNMARFLEKRGPGVHHIAYAVEDLAARLAEIREEGLRLVDRDPRPGAHGASIAFLHPRDTGGVLTELCE